MKPKINVNDVYIMCNEKQFFTAGTNDQYSRMFDMVKNNVDWHKIALVIWLCSDDYNLDEVENEITNRFDVA